MTSLLNKHKLRTITGIKYLSHRITKGCAPRLIIFLHIPKTAGTSVTRYIKDCVGSGPTGGHVRLQFAYPSENQQVEEVKNLPIHRIKYLTGHISWAVIDEIKKYLTPFVFTFLRDPSQRLASLHFHLQDADARKKGFGGMASTIEASSFQDFCSSECKELNFLANNYMVRQVAGQLSSTPTSESGWKEVLERAKYNLIHMDYVGLQETFSEDFPRIIKKTNLAEINWIPRLNVRREKNALGKKSDSVSDFDEDTRRIMEPLICWDQELYNFVKHKLRKTAALGFD